MAVVRVMVPMTAVEHKMGVLVEVRIVTLLILLVKLRNHLQVVEDLVRMGVIRFMVPVRHIITLVAVVRVKKEEMVQWILQEAEVRGNITEIYIVIILAKMVILQAVAVAVVTHLLQTLLLIAEALEEAVMEGKHHIIQILIQAEMVMMVKTGLLTLVVAVAVVRQIAVVAVAVVMEGRELFLFDIQ